MDSGELDYRRVAHKLLYDRDLCEIRYYIGKVSGDRERVASQQRLLKRLEAQNVEVLLGRVEKNWMSPRNNLITKELKKILDSSDRVIAESVRKDLTLLTHKKIPYYAEKQVDVRIAVDLVIKAYQDEYDVAYLLSADGDFVPAVKEVRRMKKKVFAASTMQGAQLARTVDTFIPLPEKWFVGLGIEDS